MNVKASLNSLRMAPRKVRLVVDLVRGLPATEAETRLKFVPKTAARPVLKLLQSAMANAEHNFKLDRSKLTISHIVADGGPTLKRFRPRAHGSAAMIRKRTTHITLVLSDEKAKLGKKAAKRAAAIERSQKHALSKVEGSIKSKVKSRKSKATSGSVEPKA